MMISRCLRFAFAAMAMAMCFGGLAFADTGEGYRNALVYQTTSAFETAGAYGHDVVLFQAKQAQMASDERTELARSGNLLKDSHGFMQAAADEVAKGTTGSTVSLYLS